MGNTLKFEFSIDEINAVLGALGAQPYQQVAALVENIRRQAAPQVSQEAPETPEVTE